MGDHSSANEVELAHPLAEIDAIAFDDSGWAWFAPLMRGMTIVAGLGEVVFARFVQRLAFLFPPEITGLVVLMVAQSLVTLGVSKFLGINYEGEPIHMLRIGKR